MIESGAGDPGEIEPGTHAFVVKIWREGGRAGGLATWRGQITHVASGQRRYITRLSQLDRFIALYLRALHVRLPLFWRAVEWLLSLTDRKL